MQRKENNTNIVHTYTYFDILIIDLLIQNFAYVLKELFLGLGVWFWIPVHFVNIRQTV